MHKPISHLIHRCVGIALLLALAAITLPANAQHKFSDSDPVAWTGTPPSRYPVHGIDVARFQNDINWRHVKRAGIEFVFMKATEGGDFLDAKFKENWRGAGKVGIARGAYHFYYFCTTPQVQARWFIRNVPRRKGTLPPVLDMEWNPSSPTCQKRPAPAEVRRQMGVFMDIVERHYGQRPLIYTTPRFFRENGLSRLKQTEFWLRTTAKTPAQAFPGQAWSFWQYSSTGIVPGISEPTDLNAFHGTRQDWDIWRQSRQR